MEAIANVPVAAKLKLEFAYDYMSRRVQKKVYGWDIGTSSYQLQSVLKFVYDGWILSAELDGSNASVDHTSANPKMAMLMARASWEQLKLYGKNRGCKCIGEMTEADWNTVTEFINVGYDPKTDGGMWDLFWKGVSDEQLRQKIKILDVPWRSANGR